MPKVILEMADKSTKMSSDRSEKMFIVSLYGVVVSTIMQLILILIFVYVPSSWYIPLFVASFSSFWLNFFSMSRLFLSAADEARRYHALSLLHKEYAEAIKKSKDISA